AFVRNGTILQLEDLIGRVETMQSADPRTRAPAQRECQFAAVAPFSVARFNPRQLGVHTADAHEGVANDSRFRVELRAIREMLQLAPAAPVDDVVRTRGIG